jgi:hypothetical protein
MPSLSLGCTKRCRACLRAQRVPRGARLGSAHSPSHEAGGVKIHGKRVDFSQPSASRRLVKAPNRPCSGGLTHSAVFNIQLGCDVHGGGEQKT